MVSFGKIAGAVFVGTFVAKAAGKYVMPHVERGCRKVWEKITGEKSLTTILEDAMSDVMNAISKCGKIADTPTE